MKAVADLIGSITGLAPGAGKCEYCGATTRLDNGCCVSCLLKENFEAEVEESAEVFEGVLAEANVPDKEWRLGNYRILEEIGRGGMGVIYRARQRHSGRIVALKRVLTYDADSHETLARLNAVAESSLYPGTNGWPKRRRNCLFRLRPCIYRRSNSLIFAGRRQL